MTYVTGGTPQVIRTYPRNYDKDIDINTVINLEFSTDLDRDYVEDNILIRNAVGGPIPCTLVYGNRLATFTPTSPLNPSETIHVTILGDDLSGRNIGVRSVLGTKMKGNYTFSFSTAASPTLTAPVLIYPTNETAIRSNPKFDWKAVVGADYYQIQVSQFNTMTPVLWPPKWELFKVFDTTAVIDTGEDGKYYVIRDTIDPTHHFEDGLYYWRMRAIAHDGKPGEWSSLHTFYIDTQEEGVVSQEDAPANDVIEFEEIEESTFEILSVFPTDAFSNVAVNLKTIYLHVLGEVTEETFDGLFEIEGVMTDGDESDPSLIHGLVTGEREFIPQGDGTTIIAFIMEPVEIEVSE